MIRRTFDLSDRYLATFPKMFHGDFTSFGTIGPKLGIPTGTNDFGRTPQTGYRGQLQVCAAALDFLDAELKGDEAGLTRLSEDVSKVEGSTLDHVGPIAVHLQDPR